uniref:Protein O-linked-mannose beta-1,2-N-acetylglucosaminyltransferase n=1 Tax=Triatoma infestans TaxID=30076 RepID=A0A023EZ29_TRIIF
MDFWQPNPRAEPFIPKRDVKLSKNSRLSSHFLHKSRFFSRIFQSLLVIVLIITIGINMVFILDTSQRLKAELNKIAGDFGGEHMDELFGRGDYNAQVDSTPASLSIEVLSSQSRVTVTVDGATIVEDGEKGEGRGMHIVVLNQASGSVMSQRLFDTYSLHEDEAMALFLNMISDGRIVIFSIKDEGTYQLKGGARSVLTRLGSRHAQGLSWRDMWAMVVQKGGKVHGESYSKSPAFSSWGASVILTVQVPLVPLDRSICSWPDTEENNRRLQFCNRIEGYGSVCSCDDPATLSFNPEPVENNNVLSVPVVVIASNRPHYLYRTLRSLLSARGARKEMITVFIDGYFEEPLEVTRLLGLRGIQHTPIGYKNSRISQHYKASFSAAFNMFPHADYIIVVEEDLDVSEDFFSYFSQTVKLLEMDSSIYCISAWNDLGYEETSSNVSTLLRVETMPGLGWLLSRILYKNELEAKWPTPEKMWDWDMWMRMSEIRKGRECVIPEVSRTFHFGASGINMNSYFQDRYFKSHSFNTQPHAKLHNIESVIKHKYEDLIHSILKTGTFLNHSISPCDDNFIPNKIKQQTTENVLILFIKMNNSKDFDTWLQVAKCFKIWDLDARGYHKAMWRLRIKRHQLLVIGYPYSPYSLYKPEFIVPLSLPFSNV